MIFSQSMSFLASGTFSDCSFCSFRRVWYHVFNPMVKMHTKARRIRVAARPTDLDGPNDVVVRAGVAANTLSSVVGGDVTA